MPSGIRFDHQINPYLQKGIGYKEIDRERFYWDSKALKFYGVRNIKKTIINIFVSLTTSSIMLILDFIQGLVVVEEGL
jgi:hypothetical protein